SIRPLKRFEKVLRLFCIRLQFHFRRQFHEENCSMFVRIRQIFERRLKPNSLSSTAVKTAWLSRGLKPFGNQAVVGLGLEGIAVQTQVEKEKTNESRCSRFQKLQIFK